MDMTDDKQFHMIDEFVFIVLKERELKKTIFKQFSTCPLRSLHAFEFFGNKYIFKKRMHKLRNRIT